MHLLVAIYGGGEDLAERGFVVFIARNGLDFGAGEECGAEAFNVVFEGVREYADFLVGIIDNQAIVVSVHFEFVHIVVVGKIYRVLLMLVVDELANVRSGIPTETFEPQGGAFEDYGVESVVIVEDKFEGVAEFVKTVHRHPYSAFTIRIEMVVEHFNVVLVVANYAERNVVTDENPYIVGISVAVETFGDAHFVSEPLAEKIVDFFKVGITFVIAQKVGVFAFCLAAADHAF